MFHLAQNRVSPETKSVSISYFLKELKTDPNNHVIMGRIVYDRKKVEFTTGIRISQNSWCSKKQQSKNSTLVNKKLIQLCSDINDAKLYLENQGAYFSVADIKKLVFEDHKKQPTMLAFCNEFLQEKQKGGECTPGTLSKYAPTFKYLREFLKKANAENMRMKQWTARHIHDFDLFVKGIIINDKGARMTLSTVNKHHVKIKTLLNHAMQKQLITTNPYDSFKLKFPYKNRDYLNSYEMALLEELNLRHNFTLQKARDLFLFSCYTGLRFQDTQDLKMSDLTVINGHVFLCIIQGKTKEALEIPIVDAAMEILKRYTDLPERILYGKALPQMSNQKTNFYLKAVAEIAGIDKALTHHMARHTCATTVLLDNGVSIEVVSKILGHTSIRTTQEYGRITHNQLLKAMNLIKK
jgi:site-specific recombinase XerD